MDTNALKTPATLPFAAWQSLSPNAATREVRARIAALPDPLRRAALAWVRPEQELQRELATSFSSKTPLRGIPYFLKDLFDFRGAPTLAGATFLDKARGMPATDSALVTRLRTLGASCAGKTHLVEFAAGLFGDNAHYGDCPHPQFPDRLSGGSSSGSAALVGAGVAPFAIGTDTGGSVRVPAAFCGVYGFRLSPADGYIRDAVALSPTLDTAGWFTASAPDMLTANSALIGPFQNKSDLRGAHIPANAFNISFEDATAAAYERAARKFTAAIEPDSLKTLQRSWQNAIDAYSVIALSDANAVHRRWLEPYRAHYEPSIWQRFTDGGKLTIAQIEHARATRKKIRTAFSEFFATHDYLILPATPFPALRKSECTPEARKSLLTLTAPASLAGLPVLTIPMEIGGGLTTGLQVILPRADSAVVPALLNAK